MIDTILMYATVALVLIYIGRSIYKIFNGSGKGCNCSSSSECPSTADCEDKRS